jgi:heme A synthase
MMEVIAFIVNVLIVLSSLYILYYAYFKKSELGKLSVYVIFASLLLQEFLGYASTVSLFDFSTTLIGQIQTFVIYGEIVLLILLAVTRLKKSSNKYLKISLIVLIVLKTLLVLGVLLIYFFISIGTR